MRSSAGPWVWTASRGARRIERRQRQLGFGWRPVLAPVLRAPPRRRIHTSISMFVERAGRHCFQAGLFNFSVKWVRNFFTLGATT